MLHVARIFRVFFCNTRRHPERAIIYTESGTRAEPT